MHPASSPFLGPDTRIQIHASVHAAFAEGKTRPIAFRKAQLSQLSYMVEDNLSRFESALADDLGRPQLETHMYAFVRSLALSITQLSTVQARTQQLHTRRSGGLQWRRQVGQDGEGAVLIQLCRHGPQDSEGAKGCRAYNKVSVATSPREHLRSLTPEFSPFNYPAWLCLGPMVNNQFVVQSP